MLICVLFNAVNVIHSIEFFYQKAILRFKIKKKLNELRLIEPRFPFFKTYKKKVKNNKLIKRLVSFFL